MKIHFDDSSDKRNPKTLFIVMNDEANAVTFPIPIRYFHAVRMVPAKTTPTQFGPDQEEIRAY